MNFTIFKNIKNYSVYINNFIWKFTFNENKIIIINSDNIETCGSYMIIYEICNYNNYYDAFLESIKYINNLLYCKLCNTFDIDFCKVCKLNTDIDNIPTTFNEECPICYNKLTIRYSIIYEDYRHKNLSKLYYIQ